MSAGFDRRTKEFRRLKRESSGRCGYCGCIIEGIPVVDHKTPKKEGGLSCWPNIIICCISCSRSKRGRDIEEYRDSVAIKNSPLAGVITSGQYRRLVEIGVDLSEFVDDVDFFFEIEDTRIAYDECHAKGESK